MRFSLFAVFALFSSVCLAIDKIEYGTLKEGDETVMDVTVSTSDGHEVTGIARRKIGAQEHFNGKLYFRVLSILELGSTSKTVPKLLRRDDTGLYSVDPADKGGVECAELGFPVNVGKSWSKTEHGTTITQTVIAIEDVTVNTKTYANCAHIQSVASDGSMAEDYWEAPGIGSIKSKIAYKEGFGMLFTLREFNLGKAK